MQVNSIDIPGQGHTLPREPGDGPAWQIGENRLGVSRVARGINRDLSHNSAGAIDVAPMKLRHPNPNGSRRQLMVMHGVGTEGALMKPTLVLSRFNRIGSHSQLFLSKGFKHGLGLWRCSCLLGEDFLGTKLSRLAGNMDARGKRHKQHVPLAEWIMARPIAAAVRPEIVVASDVENLSVFFAVTNQHSQMPRSA